MDGSTDIQTAHLSDEARALGKTEATMSNERIVPPMYGSRAITIEHSANQLAQKGFKKNIARNVQSSKRLLSGCKSAKMRSNSNTTLLREHGFHSRNNLINGIMTDESTTNLIGGITGQTYRPSYGMNKTKRNSNEGQPTGTTGVNVQTDFEARGASSSSS